MSEYQKLKARALAAQQEREREIQREVEANTAHERQRRKDEEEARKRREAASREARTLELKRANEAINKGKQAAASEEYNPFAEDERRPTPAAPVNGNASASGSKSKQTTLPTRPRDPSKPQDIPRPPLVVPHDKAKPKPKSHKGGAAEDKDKDKNKGKEVSPPALGRKEQAARALMQSAKRQGGGGATSIFSVRPNPNAASSSSSISSSSPKRQSKLPLQKRSREAALQQSADQLRALCPDRKIRDQRTIDEIQRDIKARKNPPVHEKDKAQTNGRSAGDLATKPRGAGPIHGQPKPSGAAPARTRPRASSDSSSSTSSSSSSSSPPPARKKPRAGGKSDISSMIQDIFRRPGRPALPQRDIDSDSDGSDDMEAGYSDVQEEERRAIAIARREDEIAEREERERRERKERLKKERAKA